MTARCQLGSIWLEGLTGGVGHVNSQSLLNLCLGHPNLTYLDMDLRYFSSVLHLHHFLLYFCKLSSLRLEHTLSSDPGLELHFDAGTHRTHSHHSLSVAFLCFAHMSADCASQILRLVGVGMPFKVPTHLEISLVDRPSADHLRSVASSLKQCGSHLKRFEWYNEKGNDLDAVPCTTANTSLLTLDVILGLTPSRHILQGFLLEVLSNVASPQLRWLRIDVTLLHPTAFRSRSEDSFTTVDAQDLTRAFRDVLSRSVFTQATDLSIQIEVRGNNAPLSDGIQSDMVNLFTPWLDRGFVQIDFYELSLKIYSERITQLFVTMPLQFVLHANHTE
ncbi:uncharacterized protein C8Q71DRAFT_780810 [Rhodofomes roseus]|uniref:Uncharacterized protein n=1 Tax=Rhodofomes roseus TaxID=34475 RepID=A0ABQ8K566_9APHY|nr:uncharacterized protein C8Q71DRAFT_780810 [Rhodofomes roseus]KAH9831858.1 hypothetical protein C8Q71DRAFT_780810 [Rhodofomes roseus]